MAGPRRSARNAVANATSSSPASSQGQPSSGKKNSGTKRKGSSTSASPQAKRGRKSGQKDQTTIEESLPLQDPKDTSEDTEMKDAAEKKAEDAEGEEETKATEASDDTKAELTNGQDKSENELNDQTNGPPEQTVEDSRPTENGAVEMSEKREQSTPSSILEKGIIYFFFRGRVGINEPSEVDDIARSYIVLRPLPHGAKLGQGPIGDDGHNRLLALPKKVLPVSPKDRFMVFVEKANATMEDIKNSLASSDYMTKTSGSRHTPSAASIGEGVYAITSTGRESHLAYMLTIPSDVNEVQKDIGLQQRGSFITSTKNPQQPAPANTSLPKAAEYPQEIVDEFRNLRWTALQPKHLDYENTQLLIIGHSEQSLEKATVEQAEDVKQGKDEPLKEMEKLEGEDEIRVEHLKGNDSVFEDLGLSSKEYPSLQTTW